MLGNTRLFFYFLKRKYWRCGFAREYAPRSMSYEGRLAFQGCFLVSSIFQTIAVQWLYYHGAVDGSTMLTVEVLYLSMFLLGSAVILFKRFGGRVIKRTVEYSRGTTAAEGFSEAAEGSCPWYIMATIGLIEFCASACCTFGLFHVGSGIYQVIYASLTIFTALFSRVALKKTLSRTQWIALACITMGLCLNAFPWTEIDYELHMQESFFWPYAAKSDGISTKNPPSSHGFSFPPVAHASAIRIHPPKGTESHDILTRSSPKKKSSHLVPSSIKQGNATKSHVLPNVRVGGPFVDHHVPPKEHQKYTVGICLTLLGTMLYAIGYVTTELIFRKYSVTEHEICLGVGGFGLIYSSLYIIIYTIPRWSTLVLEPILERAGTSHVPAWDLLGLLYLCLLASCCLHQWAFFSLIHSSGATSTGVLQGIRAIIVLLVSSWLYCSQDAQQCFTFQKGCVSLIVALGVIIFYLYAPPQSKSVPQNQEARALS